MIQVCTRLTAEEFDDLKAYAGLRDLNAEECARLLVTRQPVPEPKREKKKLGALVSDETREWKRNR